MSARAVSMCTDDAIVTDIATTITDTVTTITDTVTDTGIAITAMDTAAGTGITGTNGLRPIASRSRMRGDRMCGTGSEACFRLPRLPLYARRHCGFLTHGARLPALNFAELEAIALSP